MNENFSLSDLKFEVKFPTECFFLTIHCQHISLLPAIRRLQDGARNLAQIRHQIESLEKTQEIWQNLPIAVRNNLILAHHKKEAEGIQRALYCQEVFFKL